MCARCRYPPCRCGKERPKQAKYSVERKEVWTCESCQPAGNTGEHTCQGKCQKQLPAHAFEQDAERRRYAVCKECQHPACATCGQKSTEIWTPNPQNPKEVYKCTACTAAERQCTECEKRLPPSAFDQRADGHLHKVCRECQFPTCEKCGQRSTKMSHCVAKENNVYVCDDCRTERICKGRCGKSLPPSAFDRDKQRRMYQVCQQCQSKNKKQLSK